MEIKNRAHRFGDKIDSVSSGKDAVEDNFGTKGQRPVSSLTRLLWILGVLILILDEVLCYLISSPKPPDLTQVKTAAPQTLAAARLKEILVQCEG